MIEFIEKAPFESGDVFRKQTLVPVFMVKGGKEYFVANLPIAGGNYGAEYHREEMAGYKNQLYQTKGEWFKFYGHFDTPFELVEYVKENQYTFECGGKNGRVFNDVNALFIDVPEEYYGSCTDFGGNLREVSAAFRYRIYDEAIVELLKNKIREEICK